MCVGESPVCVCVMTMCVCVCVFVQESLEYLHHLSPDSAGCFIRALGPLFQQRRELRDSLMLVLRKAVFQRSIDTRTVAVDGFAVMLHQCTMSVCDECVCLCDECVCVPA